jgi:hypothetical protein
MKPAAASSRWRDWTCAVGDPDRDAFLDAIVVNAAIGGSTNAQPHIMAMARHAGVELNSSDWMEYGHKVPLLLNMQPAGKFLGERFHRAGGVPAVMWELEQQGMLRSNRMTVTGAHHGREPEGPRDQRPRSDLSVRRAAEGRCRLLCPEGQPVRLRHHEDQRDFGCLPRALPEHAGQPRTSSSAAPSCSTVRATITPASTIRR